MAEGLPPEIGELDEQVTRSKVEWQTLPFVPLVMIYSFLSRQDQYKMSRVCKNWSEGFNSPSLWKSFVLCLGEYEMLDPWPLLESVKKKCHVLKKVYINSNTSIIYSPLFEACIELFTKFLEILTRNSQLILVEFRELSYLIYQTDLNNQKIKRAICNFLGSQRQLNVVRFYKCYFGYSDGVQILRKLVESSGHSLIGIYLPDFVDNFSNEEQQEQILPALVGLPRLQSLEIDYPLVLGKKSNPSDVVEILKNASKRIMLTILLFVSEYTTDLKRLKSNDWRNLRRVDVNRRLEINIVTDSTCSEQNEYFILPGMPITVLFYKFTKSDSFSKVAQFFNHLLYCEINEHLVDLVIFIESSIPDLADALLPFLAACRKLAGIALKTVYPANGLNVLLESFAQNRPHSLKWFLLQISQIGTKENKAMLEEVTSKIVQTLKLDINLVL